MLVSLRLGSNDVAKSRAFYDATFAALGGEPSAMPAGAPIAMYVLPGGLRFLVGPAADGKPATHANGGTILLRADDENAVNAWHAAGLENGGACEAPPPDCVRGPTATAPICATRT